MMANLQMSIRTPDACMRREVAPSLQCLHPSCNPTTSLQHHASSRDVNINACQSPMFVNPVITDSTFNFFQHPVLAHTDVLSQHQNGETNKEKLTENSATQTEKADTKISTRPLRWQLEAKIKTFGQQPTSKFKHADETAIFSTDDFVVLDRQGKLVMFCKTPQASFLSKELHLTGLKSPSHVCVDKEDYLVVLDSPDVKIFHRGYPNCLTMFKPSGDAKSKLPTCLAVGDDMIAVGYGETEEISLHKPNGSLLRTLPAPMIGENLTISKCGKQLIYINQERQKLVSVNYEGHEQFTSSIYGNYPGDLSRGYGLCCDIDGYVYVSVHPGRQFEGEIFHYSPEGENMGCVAKVHGYPSGISFTPAGKLVMAVEKSIKIYNSGPALRPRLAVHKRHPRK